MPRKPRLDPPDSWHHVVNRGLAKRVMFESRYDIRYFLSRLARQVRARRIEVHAFCILQTHYHLLLRSPGGQLSEAMRRIQNAYVRRFNRQRRRDGSLARGRFFSRIVDSDEYFRALVRYIDYNAVRAGLTGSPSGHEFGSARHYLSGCGPPWLKRDWLFAQAKEWAGRAANSIAAYRHAFDIGDANQAEALVEIVESRMSALDREADADLLFTAAVAGSRAWMAWKARLADGVPLGQPVCGIGALRRASAADLDKNGVWMARDARRLWNGSELAFIGWGGTLCGTSGRRLAELAGISRDQIRHLNSVHFRLLRTDQEYADRAMEVGRLAVASAWLPASTLGMSAAPPGGNIAARA